MGGSGAAPGAGVSGWVGAASGSGRVHAKLMVEDVKCIPDSHEQTYMLNTERVIWIFGVVLSGALLRSDHEDEHIKWVFTASCTGTYRVPDQ